MNRHGLHRLMSLNSWPTGRFGLLAVDVALLEKVCHCGVGFEVSAQALPRVVYGSAAF